MTAAASLTEKSDAELVGAFVRGETAALDRLVERHGRALLGYLRGMTTDPHEAEDAFQEVWFRAIRRLSSFRNGSFRAWMTTIARNLLIDRARRRRPTISIDAADEDGRCLADQLPAGGHGPAQHVAGADLAVRVAQHVARLPEPQREVFLMRTQQNMTFAEIAAATGVPLNTALGRMHYAVTRLRKDLEGL